VTASEIILFGLVVLMAAVTIYQQVFFTKQIQTLVDKLMSRSFTEYATTKNPPAPKVVISNEIPEDLRPLQGFQI